MDSERWQRLATVYQKASVLSPPERTPFLEKECPGDADMRQEIEELLESEGKLGNFLDNTAVEALVDMYGADGTNDITGDVWDSAATDYFVGTIVDDRYVVKEYIGSGGMGDVYRAEHRLSFRSVAIKRLAEKYRGINEYRHRFVEEARRAVLLEHQNVARILDVVEDSDEVLVIMEFIEGHTLRTSLGHAFDLNRFLSIAIQCAAALESAHEKRIVHLDIKPENIMLAESGKVKVCDFGVARQLPSTNVKGAANPTWTFGGTPAYMAPEVIVGNQFDTRADIFSLGVVFYEMLAGKHPFRGEDVRATTNRILSVAAPPLLRANKKLPRQLIRLIEAMLAKEPHVRVSTASEVLRELQWIRFRREFLKDAWHSVDEAVRRRPFVAATAAAVVIIAVVGMMYFKPFSQFKPENPDAYRNYTEGIGYLRQYYEPENIETAIAKFNQALTFDPEYAKAWAGLGEAYSLKFENTENGKQEWLGMAEDDCLRARGSDDKLAAAHVCLGIVALDKERHKEAEEEFRTAIKYDPFADDAWRGLGQSLESQKNLAEAEKAYQEAIKLKPDYWASYTWLGRFYKNQSQYDAAIEQYEKALTLSPDNGRVLYSIGVPYFLSGRFEPAIKMFKEALAKQPSLEEATNNLGAAYFYMRDYKQAIPLLKNAVKGKKYTPIGNLARAFWWDGQRDEAKKNYALAVSYADARVTANSGDSDAHLAIAWYRIMLDDNDRALNHLKIAVADHGTDSHYLMIAAMVYAQMKDSQTAFACLEQAVTHGLKPFMVKAAPEFDALRVQDPKRYDGLILQQ